MSIIHVNDIGGLLEVYGNAKDPKKDTKKKIHIPVCDICKKKLNLCECGHNELKK